MFVLKVFFVQRLNLRLPFLLDQPSFFININFLAAKNIFGRECATFPRPNPCTNPERFTPAQFVTSNLIEYVKKLQVSGHIPYRSSEILKQLYDGDKFSDLFFVVHPPITWRKLQTDMANFFERDYLNSPRIVAASGQASNFLISMPELLTQASLLLYSYDQVDAYIRLGTPPPVADNIHFMGGNITWWLARFVIKMAGDFLRDPKRKPYSCVAKQQKQLESK